MKRVVVLLIVAFLAVGVVGYGLPRAALWRERALRQHQREAMLASLGPLVLDAATKAILAGADRVETFRLADFHEGEDRSAAERAALESGHLRSLDDYTVLRTGAPQGKDFAGRLNAALSTLESPSLMLQCFDPGVGFRVWKGRAHTDLCVCFYCSGVEIITQDAKHKEVFHQRAELGRSRTAFLALARQAFPQDAHLTALKG
jgi:hypothetical protein